MAGTMPSSSTTVDLSRLPAPTLLDQPGFETIVAELVADLKLRLPSFTAVIDSDPVMKLLQVVAYRELLLRQVVQDAGLQNFVAYATGAALDHLAALVGVSRLVTTPADAITGAAAVYEDDAALRQRIVLAPEGFSVAGPELAYVKHAMDASADIADASATSPAPGEVLVTVLARAGDGAAPDAMLAAVEAIVTDDAIRPLGDLVTVASAEIVPFAVSARLTTFMGPDPDLLLRAARSQLDVFLAENRRLGRDITRSGLTTALSPAGVHRVELDLDGDVRCTATQAAYCTAITISHAGFAE